MTEWRAAQRGFTRFALAFVAVFILIPILALSLPPVHAQGLTNQCINNVAAQGTSDAITSAALPCATTTNLVLLTTIAANVTTTPTYQPLGSPALVIVRASGAPIVVGDLEPGYVALLSSTGTTWVLLNPASINGITTLGTGVAAALALPVTGSGGIVLQDSPTLDSVTIAGPTTGTAGGFNYTQTFTGALTTFFPNNFTCSVNGVTGSSANALWCLNVSNNDNSTSNTAVPGGLSVAVTLSQKSANPTQDFLVALATNAMGAANDGGVSPTLTNSFTTGNTALTVSSITNILNGDFPLIKLTNGLWQSTVVSGTPSGSTVTISPGLYAAAANGNTMYFGQGTLNGGTLQATLLPSGTNYNAVIGGSATAYMEAGSSTFYRTQLSVENDVPSEGTVVGFDTMISIAAQTGVVTLAQYGILTGDVTGPFPLKSTGTWAKVGGVLAGAATGAPTNAGLANALDFSTTVISNEFAIWKGPTGQLFSLTGAGFAYFADEQLTSNYPEFVFNDTASTVTSGGLQRVSGDGSGDYTWQINTAAGGDFSTSITAFQITAAGKLNIIQGLQAAGTAGASCTLTTVSHLTVVNGIVTLCN